MLKSNWLILLLLVLACAVSLTFDIPLASIFANRKLPKFVHHQIDELLSPCETFGHGVGATLIVAAVAVLDIKNRRNVLWLFLGSLGSGMMANTIKVFVPRVRPANSGLQVNTISVWDTFDRIANSGISMQSFPSAHTATAFGLAVMLSALYPRGRWLFFLMATLVGMQRLTSCAHYSSDVFAGACVGWVAGTVCAHSMTLWNDSKNAKID